MGSSLSWGTKVLWLPIKYKQSLTVFSAFLFTRTRSPVPLPMHDKNDIEFKDSLGSFPEIKWQQLSWGRETLSLTPTLSLRCSFASLSCPSRTFSLC